jgi:SacI homology domain
MIVITNRKRVGQIRGQDIYRITSFEIVPFVKDLSSLTPAQVRHMECKKEQMEHGN